MSQLEAFYLPLITINSDDEKKNIQRIFTDTIQYKNNLKMKSVRFNEEVSVLFIKSRKSSSEFYLERYPIIATNNYTQVESPVETQQETKTLIKNSALNTEKKHVKFRDTVEVRLIYPRKELPTIKLLPDL